MKIKSREVFRKLSPNIRYLYAGLFINGIATFVMPYLAIFLKSREVSTSLVGLMVALYGLGATIAGPLSGFLMQRYHPRKLLTMSFVGSAIASLLIPLSSTPLLIAFLVFLIGLCGGLFRPVVQVLILSEAPDKEQSVILFGYLYWLTNIGFALSALFGGWLSAISFELIFYLDGLTCILGLLVLRRIDFHAISSGSEISQTQAANHQSIGKARLPITYWGVVILIFFILITQTQAWAAEPLLVKNLGLSTSDWGYITACNGIAIVLLQPAVTNISAKSDLRVMLAISAGLTGIAFFALHWLSALPMLMLHTVVWSVGEVIVGACGAALIGTLLTEDQRPTGMGGYSGMFAAATMLGPAGGTFIADKFGFGNLWSLCALVCAVSVIGFLLLAVLNDENIESHA